VLAKVHYYVHTHVHRCDCLRDWYSQKCQKFITKFPWMAQITLYNLHDIYDYQPLHETLPKLYVSVHNIKRSFRGKSVSCYKTLWHIYNALVQFGGFSATLWLNKNHGPRSVTVLLQLIEFSHLPTENYTLKLQRLFFFHCDIQP